VPCCQVLHGLDTGLVERIGWGPEWLRAGWFPTPGWSMGTRTPTANGFPAGCPLFQSSSNRRRSPVRARSGAMF